MFFNICRFLDGNHKELIAELTEQMMKASQNMEYEKAADLRDKIQAVKDIEEHQKIINTDKQNDKDVIALAREESVAFCEVFFIRNGKVIGRESYKIDNTQHSTNEEILTDFVKQFYQNSEFIPEEILTEYEVDDSEAIMKWLSGIRKRKVTIAMPKRGEKLHLVEMVRKNADIALGNYKIKVMKEREKNTVLDMMQEQLRLEKRPYRIEAYDISNIQGTDNVGAMVVFENGKPAKRKYRIFKIKSFEGADDYAAMREVIYRRFRHALEEEEQVEKGTLLKRNAKFLPLPDLILLDGGVGQVHAVEPVLREFGLKIPLFGMVKDNRHRTRAISGDGGEIAINSKRQVFTLVSEIQNEVHRFSVAYHHQKHAKRGLSLSLTEIEGVGEKRASALLKYFKTMTAIKNAEVDELSKAPGITSAVAQNIYDYYRTKDCLK